jgi:hypothetical protein
MKGDLHGAGSRREGKEKEMTMNALATVYRNTACAAAAALICVLSSMAFVESTAVVPGTQPEFISIAHVSAPSWFGKPEPAVLVD